MRWLYITFLYCEIVYSRRAFNIILDFNTTLHYSCFYFSLRFRACHGLRQPPSLIWHVSLRRLRQPDYIFYQCDVPRLLFSILYNIDLLLQRSKIQLRLARALGYVSGRSWFGLMQKNLSDFRRNLLMYPIFPSPYPECFCCTAAHIPASSYACRPPLGLLSMTPLLSINVALRTFTHRLRRDVALLRDGLVRTATPGSDPPRGGDQWRT